MQQQSNVYATRRDRTRKEIIRAIFRTARRIGGGWLETSQAAIGAAAGVTPRTVRRYLKDDLAHLLRRVSRPGRSDLLTFRAPGKADASRPRSLVAAGADLVEGDTPDISAVTTPDISEAAPEVEAGGGVNALEPADGGNGHSPPLQPPPTGRVRALLDPPAARPSRRGSRRARRRRRRRRPRAVRRPDHAGVEVRCVDADGHPFPRWDGNRRSVARAILRKLGVQRPDRVIERVSLGRLAEIAWLTLRGLRRLDDPIQRPAAYVMAASKFSSWHAGCSPPGDVFERLASHVRYTPDAPTGKEPTT